MPTIAMAPPQKRQELTTEPKETWVDDDDAIRRLDSINPLIPIDVVAYYLNSAGFNSSDPRALKLVALTVENFINEIAKPSDKLSSDREVKKGKLKTETLAKVLSDYGVNIVSPSLSIVKKNTKGKATK